MNTAYLSAEYQEPNEEGAIGKRRGVLWGIQFF